MVADERLGIAVNVTGDPVFPTLVEVATDTDMVVGLVFK
jgi:hypothetical protein